MCVRGPCYYVMCVSTTIFFSFFSSSDGCGSDIIIVICNILTQKKNIRVIPSFLFLSSIDMMRQDPTHTFSLSKAVSSPTQKIV